jgi:HEAT repeat protein
VRAFAVRALGDSREPSAVPALIRALSDADPYVFREAHRGLVLATPAMVDAFLPEPLDAARIAKVRADWRVCTRKTATAIGKHEAKENGR